MLQIELLAAYAARHHLSLEPAFVRATATLVIDLDKRGNLLSITTTTKPAIDLTVPRTDDGRTSNPLPRLLDTAEYTFEGAGDSEKHTAFIKLVSQLDEDIGDDALSAAVSYIARNPRGPLTEYKDGNVAFRVEGEWPYERPLVKDFFRAWYQCRPKTATCRITGKLCAPPPTHPKIRNLLEACERGAKATSSTFVSFNVDSARFCGKQADNYPLCDVVVYGYTDAMNYLLAPTHERRHRSAAHIGNEYLTILWTQDGRDLTHYLNLLEPEAPGLKEDAFIEAIRAKRRAAAKYLETQFFETETVYALTVKAHQGRIATYGWEVMPIGRLARNLCQFIEESHTTLSHLVSLMGRRGRKSKDGLYNPEVLQAVICARPWPPKVQHYVLKGTPNPIWLRTLVRNHRRTPCPQTTHSTTPTSHPRQAQTSLPISL